MAEKIEVENVNHPGLKNRVDAKKYTAMRQAVMTVFPDEPPGLSFDDAVGAIRTKLPHDLFPGGKTSGWWFKTVQLDLEAKGVMARSATKPLKWHLTGK